MTYAPADERYERMVYRRSGRSGLQLPAISLGFWWNFGDDRPLETCRAIVRRAFDLGITHFDLANNYGPPYGSAEENFGRLLRHDLRPFRDELEVVGERASLFVDDPWHVNSPGIELRRETEAGTIEIERISVKPASSYQLELENVSDAIRGEAFLLLGRDDALGQARTIEALYRSAEAGVPVEIEQSACSPIPASDWSDS